MADRATTPRRSRLRGMAPATQVMVRERRRRLCGAADGRVLDLTDAARLTDFRRADEVVAGLDAAEGRPGADKGRAVP